MLLNTGKEQLYIQYIYIYIYIHNTYTEENTMKPIQSLISVGIFKPNWKKTFILRVKPHSVNLFCSFDVQLPFADGLTQSTNNPPPNRRIPPPEGPGALVPGP